MPWLNLAMFTGDSATTASLFCETRHLLHSLSQNLHMMICHTTYMRKSHRATGIALCAIAFSPIAFAPSAIADSSPQVSPTPNPTRLPQEQYRIDRENYLTSIRVRSIQIRNINSDFKVACDTAALTFKNAMATARTPDQKNAAIAARKSAISAAIAARDAAIAALGAEPTPPAEPMKPMNAGKGKSR